MRQFVAMFALLISASCAAKEIDYVRDVKPLLAANCFSCHGPLKQKGGLRLDVASLINKGGKSGKAVIAGHAADSPLIQALLGTNDFERMPAEASPLPNEQIAILREWIDQGAKAPDEPIPPDPHDHWAFRAPVRPSVPKIKDKKWAHNPIDAFIASEHQKRGLVAKPQADKATLLRRVYLDLIGLPPTREQLEAFLNDNSRDAYEKIVEKLLADPHYGERWGRHWMDVWRYSDWAGYGMEVRDSQPHLWRWRDWIIESLNADVPYDAMVLEMLAGDELAPDDPQILRATGYLARNYYRYNRNVWLDNTVEHAGKAFLGLTFNCARCHDHMFDPIAQKEYYQLRAFFEPYNIRTERVPGQRDTTKDGLTRIVDADLKTQTFLFRRGNEADPEKEPLAPAIPKIFGAQAVVAPISFSADVCNPDLRQFVIDEETAHLKAECERARTEVAKAEEAVVKAHLTPQPPSLEGKGEPERPASAGVFISDDFSAAKPEVWQRGAGQWEYKNGKLAQTQLGLAEHAITSVAEHPQDFSVRFKFKITGGMTYHSVGFNFDTTADSENTVYLSAHAPGPKAQISWRMGNNRSYPETGMVAMPIKVGQEYALRVDARGQLLNVYVDDKLVLAFSLPHARKTGKMAFWTYDATAEFISVQVDKLAADAKLAEKAPASSAKAGATPAETLKLAEEAVPIAKAKLTLAEAERDSYAARVAADRVKFSAAPAKSELDALSKKAAEAEGIARIAKAEYEVLQTQAALNSAKKDKKDEAEKKFTAAKKARDEAKSAGEKPYTSVGSPIAASSSGRRLAFAKWIASKSNPLSARVVINHMWMRHFGEPLVPTVFDFGLKGKPPVNPQLLDWLACELMDREWSMKDLHRMMVTSAAYRMQTTSRDDNENNMRIDPDNIYLWRANTKRMEAEIVRDSVLHLAGKLDAAMGGPELDQESALKSNRRSIYVRHANEKQATFLKLFDAPNPNECYRRYESVVPQQALALANSSLSWAQSRILAAALTKETQSDSQFVTVAFEQVLARFPTQAEAAACSEFLVSQAALFKDATKLEAFSAGEASAVPASKEPAQRARENLVHVLFNHNDFVTIR